MVYSGVKFRTVMIGTDIPLDHRISALEDWCKEFHQQDVAPPYDGGSCGNLSFRIQQGQLPFIITAAQSGLADSTTSDRFVTVTNIDLMQGIVYAIGARKPSSEAMVHFAIYRARPNVNAVFHGHCPCISKNAARFGIPITSQEEPYGTLALVHRVQDVLGENDFVEMRNHGFLAMGKTMDEAGKLTLTYLRKCRSVDPSNRIHANAE